MANVLDKIMAAKREEVAELKRRPETADLPALAAAAPPVRDFTAALRAAPRVALISEIKKASPSAGEIRPGLDVAAQAAAYAAGGASCLSVLTDGVFFGGSLADLSAARAAVSVPALRKDFVFDPVQLYQARAAGADAVLLIAAALDPGLLAELYAQARELGLTALVEVHNEDELGPVLDLDPPLVGVNNRDLTTLQVDLDTCVRLRGLIPAEVLVVAESGVHGPDDIRRLRERGLDAFLVGTSLMQAADPAAAVRALVEAV